MNIFESCFAVYIKRLDFFFFLLRMQSFFLSFFFHVPWKEWTENGGVL